MKERKIGFIYWFAYYNLDSPSVRYRAKYPLEYFRKKHDIRYRLVLPGYSLKRMLKFISAYFSALLFPGKNSIIVIQRVYSSFIYATLLKVLIRLRSKVSVYDLDDAEYLVKDPKTIYHFVKKCHAISAGSRKIAEHLAVFNPNIAHITSPVIDLNIIKKKKNNVFTIGWIGGFGGEHKESLIKLVFPALKTLDFRFRLRILGVTLTKDVKFIEDYFSNNKWIQLEIPENIDWKNESRVQQNIATFDIGIATLVNSEMHLSKSGIKAKQYMNNGVPVLSTRLPENDTVVMDGKNGFFCSTPDEFRQRIVEFHDMSEEAYRNFSKNARETIQHFNHEKYLMAWKHLMNGNSNGNQITTAMSKIPDLH